MNKIKILLVSHSYILGGGAERSFLEMIQSLSKTNSYEIYTVFPLEDSLSDLCKPFCKRVYAVNLPQWIYEEEKLLLKDKYRRLLTILSATKKAYRLISEIKPKIVITNTSVIPTFGIAAFFARVKHCWYVRELVDEDFNCYYLFGTSFSRKLINFLSELVFVNSKFVQSRYIRYVKKKKLKLMYQSVNCSYIKQTEKDTKQITLLILGTVSEFKGQSQAILATEELLNRDIKVQLYVVGPVMPNYLKELKSLISKKNQDKIYFTGSTSVPYEYYAKADIVLVCSQNEAMGRVTIEAMKMAIPVIASNRGGSVELIQDGFNGYLYEYGDSLDLADKILKLVDPYMRKTLGENGKKWAEQNFNQDKFTEKFDSELKLL